MHTNQFTGFKIGNVELKTPLVLAPMSGVTNSCFRRLVLENNRDKLGLVVTEFISIEGLTRNNKQSLKMMDFRDEERPISVQIFGGEETRMLDAALMAQDRGADIVDINCGCPVPKVVKKGGGCELMRQPGKLFRMLSNVSNKLSVPLTLKIRAGWDNDSRNALEIATMAEEAGIKMLAIHGRTRTEGYRGIADWEIIGEVAERLSIPVIGSGDVIDYDSARTRFNFRR